MEVVWSARSKRRHREIIAYIAADNELAAEKVGRRLIEVGDALGEYPTGRPGRLPRTYEKSIPQLRYILIYAIERRPGADRIAILDIVHSRQEWPPGD
jgi:toxin ParE1/3/4